MNQTRRHTRPLVGGLADRVEKAVDRSADTAEEIHRKVASLPLNVLEQVDSLEGVARDIREFQERSIGAVYSAVHDINHEVMRLARELLGSRPARRRARPRKKVVKTKRAVAEADTA
jgi:hypothetical protein